MSDLAPTRPRPGLPLGLLGMLALVAAVELTIQGRRLDFTTVWADDWRRTAEATAREARGRDVLCFGDSLVKYGVLPRVIEAKTGLRSYNLAINAGTMPSAYFLLRRTLESGVRPRAIVADFFALMLPDAPRVSVRMYPELAGARDCLDLARTSADPSFLAATLTGKLLPSYKCRFEIRNSLVGAFRGVRTSPWPAQAAVWASWKAEAGAQPMPQPPARFPADPAILAQLNPGAWECDPINAEYFDRFLALARSENLPVFWLMPPLGPELQALRSSSGADAAYTRFAKLAMVRHPGLTILDARAAGYDATVHIDAIHLDRRGAEILTADLANHLADRLAGRSEARWVDLPPFAGRASQSAGSPGIESTRR